MSNAKLREMRQEMEVTRARLRQTVALNRLAWLSITAAVILVLGAITLCAIDLLTVGSAAAYAAIGFVFGFVGGGLMAFLDTERKSIVEARHAFENAQEEYYEALQRG